MENFFVGWIPTLSGHINFFADGANSKTERSLLHEGSKYNNSDSIHNISAFKSYFRCERYLDDDALPDMALAFGNAFERICYKTLKKFGLASSGIAYSSFVRAEIGVPDFIKSIIPVGENYKSVFGYGDSETYLKVEFSQMLNEPCDGLLDYYFNEHDRLVKDFQQQLPPVFDRKLADFYSDINLRLSNGGMGNALQRGVAYIFPNGLVILRFSDWIKGAVNGDEIIQDTAHSRDEKIALIHSIYEVYSFLRDSWHFHRFHKDDDDLILKFKSFKLGAGFDFAKFKTSIVDSLTISKENIHKSYILRQRPGYIREDLDYLDLNGLALYLKSFCRVICEIRGTGNSDGEIHSDHFEIITTRKKEIDGYSLTSRNFILVWLGLFVAWMSIAMPENKSFVMNDAFSLNGDFSINGLKFLFGKICFIGSQYLNFKVDAYDWMFLFLVTTFVVKYIYDKFSYLSNARSGMSYLQLPQATYTLMRALAQGSFISFSRFSYVNFGVVEVISYGISVFFDGINKSKIINSIYYAALLFIYICIAFFVWGIVSIVELLVCVIFILLPVPITLYFKMNNFIYLPLLFAKTIDAVFAKKLNSIEDNLINSP